MVTPSSIQRILAPIMARLRGMIRRGVVALVEDAGARQLLQVTLGPDVIREGVERYQEYGFATSPPTGADALVVQLGASADHPVVICVEDRRWRLRNLQAGEVALYTDEGDCLHFQRGGILRIEVGSQVQIVGNVSVEGAVQASSVADSTGTLDDLRQQFLTHIHTVVGAQTLPPL